jgi:hypothetical protein
LAGDTGTGNTNSANYAVQTRVPTATIVVADTRLLKVGDLAGDHHLQRSGERFRQRAT